MATPWWQKGATTSYSSDPWPILIDKSVPVSLGRPWDDDEINYELVARELAPLIPMSIKTARLLLYLYGRDSSLSLEEQAQQLVQVYEIPSTVASFAMSQVNAIQKALIHYASVMDWAARSFSSSIDTSSLTQMLRTVTHALYGIQSCVNTLAIASGMIPIASSAYVQIKPSIKIGPCKRHAYFLGPDGQADPEIVLFAPSPDLFCKPLDTLMVNTLVILITKCASQLHAFPNATIMWSPLSSLNRTWRKHRQIPHLAKRVREESDQSSSDDD